MDDDLIEVDDDFWPSVNAVLLMPVQCNLAFGLRFCVNKIISYHIISYHIISYHIIKHASIPWSDNYLLLWAHAMCSYFHLKYQLQVCFVEFSKGKKLITFNEITLFKQSSLAFVLLPSKRKILNQNWNYSKHISACPTGLPHLRK